MQTYKKQCLVESLKLRSPIVSLTVLYPPPGLLESLPTGGERAAMPLLAFSATKRTFIVSMNPEPKVRGRGGKRGRRERGGKRREEKGREGEKEGREGEEE